MAIDLSELVRPERTALLLQECQQGVIGKHSALPDLAEAAAKELIPNAARLARAARRAGVRVIHTLAHSRPDGFGRNTNGPIFHAVARSPVKLHPGSEAVEVMPEIGVEPSDVVLYRIHGLSPFHGSELDPLLRNAGITTLVAAGVSVNVAILNLTFDAVNSAYQVVIPRDAVAGWPREYVEMVFANTLRAVATLTTTDALVQAWAG